MFRMGPAHAEDNGPGVSGAEPERTARYQDLLYAQRRIRYHRSHKNRPRACAYLAGKKGGIGVPSHATENPRWPPDDPSRMWPHVTRYDHHKYGTNYDTSVFPKLCASCHIYNLLCNYQFTRIEGAGHDQEYMSTCITGVQVTVYNTR